MAASRSPDMGPRGAPRVSIAADHRQKGLSQVGLTQRAVLNVLETFFRRPLVYLVPLILMVALGVGSAATAKDEYRSVGVLNASTGTMLSELTGNDQGFGYERPSVVTARNINELLGTETFLASIIAQAGLTAEVDSGLLSRDEIRRSISAEASGDTLVSVSATTLVPERSELLAEATLDGFVEYVATTDIADATVRVDTYERLRADNRVLLDRADRALEQYLLANPAAVEADRPIEQQLEIDRLQSAVSRADDAYRSTETNLNEAQLAADVSRTVVDRQLRVIDEPSMPNSPLAGLKGAVMTVAIFVVLGLMLSLALVVLAALLDRTVRLPSDVTSKSGLEVMGVVPSARRP